MRILLPLALSLAASLTDAPAANDFIPIDIGNAYALGCIAYGIEDDPGHGHAETMVIVRWQAKDAGARKAVEGKGYAEFAPIMSHRPDFAGAIDDCDSWYKEVKKRLLEPPKEQK